MKRKVGRPRTEPGTVTYVRVPDAHREELMKISHEDDRPVAALIREGIRMFLESRKTTAAA